MALRERVAAENWLRKH